VQCNVGKRGWMAGIGGCPNVCGVCIGCTMPGFPDKFMPFLNEPPGRQALHHRRGHVWPYRSRSARFHPGVAQQGTGVAHQVKGSHVPQ